MSRRRAVQARAITAAGARRPVRRMSATPAATAADAADPQGLTVNLWFDSVAAPAPYTARVRLVGRRADVSRPGPRDTFVREEVIDGVVPDSGPVAITMRVFDINAGHWHVDAEMLPSRQQAGRSRSARPRWSGESPVHRAVWSWPRWRLQVGPQVTVRTRLAPLTGLNRMPAVIPGSWLVLVALGVVVGFFFQARLLPREHVDPARTFLVSLLAVASGVVGAKLWFVGLRRTLRGVWRDGMCIQGALVGAAMATTASLAVLHVPVGPVLDATTPGLFVGMAIGRVGCFLTGCCAGRPTASRWALWSSDRRVGARRVPTQLLESLSALVIGLASLAVILRSAVATSGAVFVGSFATYTLCRQFLLHLRAEGRRTSRGGRITAAVSATTLAASLAILVIGGH